VAGTDFRWGHPVKGQAQRRSCLLQDPSDLGVGDVCPLSNFLPMGSTTADWNGAFATNFRYKGLGLNLLMDGAFGQDIYNNTLQWGLRQGRVSILDQVGKPEDLWKPFNYYQTLYDTNIAASHFVEDGTWVKFREISVGYTLPQSFMQSAFKGTVDRITLNLIGRNLFTITDYTGYDPEVGTAGGSIGSTSLNRVDDFGYPNFRTFTAALELVF